MAQAVETELVDTREAERDSSERPGSANRDAEEKGPGRKVSRWILLVLVTVALASASLWWLHSQNYESTDDAEIDGHLDLVSARISGTVTYINPRVENNQLVESGTLLMELDPRDYAAELEHAKANLDTRNAEARSAQVTVPIVDASAFGQLHSAEAAKEQALASVRAEERRVW